MSKEGTGVLRESVVFVLQKGKQSRVEQPSALLALRLGELLSGHAAPLEVELQVRRGPGGGGALGRAWLREACGGSCTCDVAGG